MIKTFSDNIIEVQIKKICEVVSHILTHLGDFAPKWAVAEWTAAQER